jgi:acetylornithine deacetylase/succinyl-diaminopimelate desuccinylase-like protein
LVNVTPTADDPVMPGIEDYLTSTSKARLADFIELLRYPSIGTLPEHAGDMARTAEFICDRLREVGFDHVEASPTPGHPIVYADWLHAPGAPTVLVYAHYDVQPVDPLELWHRPPFEPVVENGRVYARGAADDKSHVTMHLWAAQAWLANGGSLPVNLKIVFEGEEESGSTNFDTWVEANRERLAADVSLVCDLGFFEGNRPAITVGLRGMIYAQLDVTGPALDLHSGSFGGNVQNPANALAEIIAGLKNPDGTVAVPGFYDEWRPLSDEERSALARLPFDEAAFRAEHGLLELFGEPGFSPMERRGVRPTLDVNGIWGGFQGEGSKTIIPAHAHAKISCRLVPDMTPARTFECLRAHILRSAPPGVKVEVTLLNEGMWSLVGIDHPATQALAASMAEVFGVEPLYIREGGSVPAAATFGRVLNTPVVMVGFIQPDCQLHAPNESMRLDNFERGVRTIVRYWQHLAQSPIQGS